MILASHLGRPKGKPTPEFSLKPVADSARRAAEARRWCSRPTASASRRRAPSTHAHADADPRSSLLENLRFHAEEEKNDAAFAKALAALADVYVNDAFGAAHRAHASVAAIVPHFGTRAAAGLLMEKELRYLGHGARRSRAAVRRRSSAARRSPTRSR